MHHAASVPLRKPLLVSAQALLVASPSSLTTRCPRAAPHAGVRAGVEGHRGDAMLPPQEVAVIASVPSGEAFDMSMCP